MRYFSSTFSSEAVTQAQEVLEVVREAGDDASAAQIQAAIEQFQAARFSLAILGKVKRGKSTLINALLGRSDDLAAPIDKLPASSTISHFRWNDREQVDVYFRDGQQKRVALSEVRDYATEQLNPDNQKNVELLEIAGPFEGLKGGLELIDTPGAGSLHEHHDALLHAFIPQADAVIFLVSAQMPLDQEELDLLKKVKEADVSKIFFAINRIDEATPADLDEAEQHNQRLLEEIGIKTSKMYRVSAKRAFQGQVADSGVPELVADIQHYIQVEKGVILRDRFGRQIRLAAEPVVQRMAMELECANKSQEELTESRAQLAEESSRLKKEQPLAEREFTNGWEAALQQFQHDLEFEEKAVRKELLTRIQDAPLTKINALVKDLPTIMQELIEDRLAAPRQKLESSLLDATQKLQATFPQLRASELEIDALRPGDHQVMVPAAGLAAGAMGGGLIFAGSTVAAQIAAANAAAAAAATTTVAAPTLAGTILTTIFPQASGLVGTLLTGSASVSMPAAYTAVPLWVALSGPVGWTMVGVGTLAIPFGWRISKLKTKDKLEEAVRSQVKEVFAQLRKERVGHLQQMGKAIIEDFKLRSDRQLSEMELILEQAESRSPDPERSKQLAEWSGQLRALLGYAGSGEPLAGSEA